VLGRFLEISVRSADIPASLAFYESLGFVQAVVGDSLNHPYAVITDGRLYLGLHGRDFESPTLTWVQPGLAAHVQQLRLLDIALTVEQLGEDTLHEVGFVDPSGQAITLLEARTFSPPAIPPTHVTRLGYFEEFGLPTDDLQRATAFWDALGFVAFDSVRTPFTRVVAAGRDLNVGLYDVDLRRPVLTFSDPAMPERIATLREQGHRFVERLPRGMNPLENALLEAPEGTWLLLTTEQVSGLQPGS
jgi:catechol 2,3-dioxygenase-like lactoylglutathione lyase family enzyme